MPALLPHCHPYGVVTVAAGQNGHLPTAVRWQWQSSASRSGQKILIVGPTICLDQGRSVEMNPNQEQKIVHADTAECVEVVRALFLEYA